MQAAGFINREAIKTNLINSFQESSKELKLMFKYVMPYALAATILYGLSEEASLRPCSDVAWVVSKSLYVGAIILVAKGCHSFCETATSNLDPKRVIVISTEQQIHNLNLEIIRLKEENEILKMEKINQPYHHRT